MTGWADLGIALANSTNCDFTNHLITKKEKPMTCPKCSGMMFSERLSDFFLTFYAWKCVNCGSIVDHTILENQQKERPSLAQR